jgi:hypothetical protein
MDYTAKNQRRKQRKIALRELEARRNGLTVEQRAKAVEANSRMRAAIPGL